MCFKANRPYENQEFLVSNKTKQERLRRAYLSSVQCEQLNVRPSVQHADAKPGRSGGNNEKPQSAADGDESKEHAVQQQCHQQHHIAVTAVPESPEHKLILYS